MKTILLVFSLLLASCCAYAQADSTSTPQIISIFLAPDKKTLLEDISAGRPYELHALQGGQTGIVEVVVKGYKRKAPLRAECSLHFGSTSRPFKTLPWCAGAGSKNAAFAAPDTNILIGSFPVPDGPPGIWNVELNIYDIEKDDFHPVATLASAFKLVRPSNDSGGTYGTSGATTTPYQPRSSQGPIGAKYGTRDPMTCPSTKEPVNGPISAEQAKLYFMCGREYESGGLYLVDNVTVEVGRGHRPTAYELSSDQDPDRLVYPIRGSFVSYYCFYSRTAPGSNCNATDQPQASGKCYQTSFGDWHCEMMDAAHLSSTRHDVPPPQ